MKHLLSVDEFYRCNGVNESNYQSRNEKTVEYKGFEYKEDSEEFNPVEFGWSKKEIDDFYNKKNNVLLALNDLNIASSAVNAFLTIGKEVISCMADPWNAGIILQCLLLFVLDFQ